MIPAPYIIIGMHRSGTSFLAKVLESAGIFMGVVKDHNYEAMHFLSLNQQMIWAAGGDWHRPVKPGPEHWRSPAPRSLYYEHFKVQGRLAQAALLWRRPDWGWKDPRNSFTLDCWLEHFPQAKVIHLWRDVEAVVASLQKRNLLPGEVREEALNDAAFCRQLYSQYRSAAEAYAQKLGPRYLSIDYASLRAGKGPAWEALESFTGRSLAAAHQKFQR